MREIYVDKVIREVRRFTNEDNDRVIYRVKTDEGETDVIGNVASKGKLPNQGFFLAGEFKKGQFHWVAALNDVNEVETHRKLQSIINGTGIQKSIPGKLIAMYGLHAAEFVRRNPFLMLPHASASFERCDKLWLRFGRPVDSIKRQLLFLVDWMARKGDGSTWYSSDRLQNMLNTKFGKFDPKVLRLGKRTKLLALRSIGDGLDGETLVADASSAENERFVAKRIREANAKPSKWPKVKPGMMGPDQIQAVEAATQANIGCLVGGAGVGKTFALANILVSIGDLRTCCVLAPTGKAAVRANQAINEAVEKLDEEGRVKGAIHASTIHRAMFLRPGRCVQFFIIDESSMIDLALMAALFEKIIPEGACVLFVGDSAQLPPVAAGAPFRDFAWLDSYGEITKTRRNAGQILESSHQVRRGEKFDHSDNSNLKYFPVQEEKLCEVITNDFLAGFEPPNPMDPKDWEDHTQILAPTNSVCAQINAAVRLRLFGIEPNAKKIPFVQGDLVMNTSNDYFIPAGQQSFEAITNRAGMVYVANGEKGYVKSVNRGKCNFILLNPYRSIYVWTSEIESQVGATGTSWRHAYAITVHKSQGSDWPTVLCAISKQGGSHILDRSLVYTMLTRAKEECRIYGDISIAYKAIRTNKIDDRRTLLQRCLEKWSPSSEKAWVMS